MAVGFNSGGWDTAGVPGTDERYGIMVDWTVGVRIEGCDADMNDINYYSTNANAVVNGYPVSSPNTSTVYENCTSRMARVHAIKWLNSLSQRWVGGIIESNAGLVTVLVKADAGAVGPSGEIRGAHWEGNHRKFATGAVGSRAIMFDNQGTTPGLLFTDGEMGDNKPEIGIELVKATGSRLAASINGTLAPVKVGSTCADTRVSGHLNGAIIDAGAGTVVESQVQVLGASAALVGATPSVSNTRYAQAGAVTITNLTNGTDGQIVTLVGQNGTVLSSVTNFLLRNGATTMRLAPGSIITLRKEPSGPWKCIGHMPSTVKATVPAGSNVVAVDDREVWVLDDTNTTGINIINNGYEGQRLTLIGKHTGTNTTTLITGTGNLRLAGAANITMGVNDTLTLVYDAATNRWNEVARCVSTATTLTGAALLDFPSIAAGTTAELTITVTGAATGNIVVSNAPAALAAGLMHSARVTAADTVTVRLANVTAAAIDPGSQSWTVRVLK